jgi:tRNA threonylcarbamoyladenosine biosynthesis protein TsaE
MKKFIHYLKNEESTQAIAQQLARVSIAPLQIHLAGELGSGKTSFARAFLQALGIDTAIKSPSYSLVESYAISDMAIFHFDLYRLGHPEELALIGYRDYLADNALWLIEWPEKALAYLPPADLHIHLSFSGEGRLCEIQAITEKGDRMLDVLDTA